MPDTPFTPTAVDASLAGVAASRVHGTLLTPRSARKPQGGEVDLPVTVPDTGNPLTNGTNLQLAINSAVAGSTIVLAPGVEYRGNFTLPNKTGSSYITILTSSLRSLPPGTRVSPSSAASMPTLTTPNGSPVFSFNVDSHHWRLQGLEVTTATGFPNSTRAPGLIGQAEFTYGHWPHDVDIDRCYIHALEVDPCPYRAAEEGVILDGSAVAIHECWIGNFTGWEYPEGDHEFSNTVTAATNASPCQVTLQTAISNPGHKFFLYLTGATLSWTGLNGLKVCTYVNGNNATLENYDPDTFALSNVDSQTWGALSGTVRTLTQYISTSRALLMIAGPGPYTITNNFLEAYYSPIFTGGGGLIPPENKVTVTAVNSLTEVELSGVGDLAIGDLIAFGTTQDQSISTAAPLAGDATRTNLTVQTHGFPVGTQLYPEGYMTVSGFTGNWAALNGNWGNPNNVGGTLGIPRVEDSTHISIPIDSTGFGAVTGSGMKWVATTKQNSGPTQWQVGHVTNISGTTVTYEWWGHQPENLHGNGAGILVAWQSTAQFNGTPLASLTVTRNTLSIRRNWIWLFRDIAKTGDNIGQTTKCQWEAKAANDVTITGNIFQIEGGDLAPSSGTIALGLNQASQNGDTPWASLNNWLIQSNIFRHHTLQAFATTEEYESGSVGTNISFDNNLCTVTKASFISFSGTDNLVVTHNTVRNLGTGSGTGGGSNGWCVITRAPNTNAVIRDNIGCWVSYGYIDNLGGATWTRENNYLIDNLAQNFTPPGTDVRVPSEAAMKFVDLATADADGDYHGYALASDSPGHDQATDGGDVGVNFTALDAALNG